MSKIEAETVSCMHCGDTILLDESISHHDDTLCADCAENYTTFCSHCGDRIWNSADYGDGSLSLCEHCRDDHFTTCTECDALLNLNDAHYEEDDDERPFCGSCFDDLETRPIHNYSYKPEPVFFGSGCRFFGVELEVDYAGRSDDNARRILEILNRKRELGYIKCDGSLDDGMELVLHPMTLYFHLNQMPCVNAEKKMHENAG